MNLTRTDTEILTPTQTSDKTRLPSSSGYFADSEASQSSLGSSVGLYRNLTTSLATIECASEEEEDNSERPLKRKRGEKGSESVPDLDQFQQYLDTLTEDQARKLLLSCYSQIPESRTFLLEHKF